MAIEMMNCFGGSATAMPISDVYTAMQSGVIDGAENNETALTVGGHGEVAKCYSYDEHTRIPDIVLISTKVWNKFSAEQQEIVQAAADAAKETYKADWQAAIEQAVKDADKPIWASPSITPILWLRSRRPSSPSTTVWPRKRPEVLALCEKIQAFQADRLVLHLRTHIIASFSA